MCKMGVPLARTEHKADLASVYLRVWWCSLDILPYFPASMLENHGENCSPAHSPVGTREWWRVLKWGLHFNLFYLLSRGRISFKEGVLLLTQFLPTSPKLASWFKEWNKNKEGTLSHIRRLVYTCTCTYAFQMSCFGSSPQLYSYRRRDKKWSTYVCVNGNLVFQTEGTSQGTTLGNANPLYLRVLRWGEGLHFKQNGATVCER